MLLQGCAQCLDSTRATPPAVQAAYRHAIMLLAGFAGTIFTAGVLLCIRIQNTHEAQNLPPGRKP